MQIIKSNITQQVIEYLKKNIEDGNWPVGSKIPSETELTNTLGISRGSVRMAVRQLIALDILESHQGRGTFVRESTVRAVGRNLSVMSLDDSIDISKILEFRSLVEPEAAFLAAHNAGTEEIARLESLLAEMKGNVGNPEAFVRADLEFHQVLCRASGNPLMADCLLRVFDAKLTSHKIMTEAYGYNDAIYFHTCLIQAIRAHDAAKARKAMKEHILQAIDRQNDPATPEEVTRPAAPQRKPARKSASQA